MAQTNKQEKTTTEVEVQRQPVNFRYDALNWDFIKMLAEIAYYASEKYGSPEQYTYGRLTGEKGPINHIYEHLRQYQTGELHDHFDDQAYHLAAIAYNAMIEFYYHQNFGYQISPLFNVEENPQQLPQEIFYSQDADKVFPKEETSSNFLHDFLARVIGAKKNDEK